MAGIDTFVQVAVDGAGKMVRNFSNLIGGNTVYQQVVTRAKSDGTLMEDEGTEATQLLIKARTDNIPPLGQALAAASTPVVLPAAQVTTLTPPAAITGFALDATVAKDASLTTIDADLKTLDTDLQTIAQNTRAQPWYTVPLPTTPWFT